MTVIFAAGDVGGARALLPVARLCHARGLPFAVLRHGFIADAIDPDWSALDPAQDPAEALAGLGTRCLAFATSVHDTLALRWARAAASQGLRTVHLLDNWTSYRRRLEHDGRPPFRPDIYAVPDDLAAKGAIEAGVDPATVRVTGQPDLAALALAKTGAETRPGRAPGGRRRAVLFVSEPAAQDQGASPDSPTFRGYTETQVLALLCEALVPLAGTLTLNVLPHPREDAAALTETWARVRGPLDGTVLPPGHGRAHMLASDAVVGMASILLYEAWLVGLPVLSLQPDLRVPALASLSWRDGVAFINAPAGDPRQVRDWLAGVRQGAPRVPRPDLERHAGASEACLALCRPNGTEATPHGAHSHTNGPLS